MWGTNLRILGVVLGTVAVYTLLANAIPQVESEVPEELSFTGDVMVSSGDELVDAVDPQPVSPGQTIMVPEGGTATITYADGTVLTYGPGTYTVPTLATAQALTAGETVFVSAGVTAAIVAGVVVVTAALIDQNLDESDEAPPLSP